MKVGIQYNSYAEERNILNNKNSTIVFKTLWDSYKLKYAQYKIGIKMGKKQNLHKELYLKNTFKENLFTRKVDLIHLFNGISYGEIPWVTTFETVIPRYQNFLDGKNNHHKRYNLDINDNEALIALSSDNCKKIIAFSKSTKAHQLLVLDNIDSDLASLIREKITVVYPPQEILIDKDHQKIISSTKTIEFVFVGRLFFVKGGLELLETFIEFANHSQISVNLTIISSLSLNDHLATKDYTTEDIKLAQRLIEKNSKFITFFEKLSNQEVIEVLKKSDIGVLPTYADTFGYSVLEMQACGLPVITTDVRALKEINDKEKGWIISLPKDIIGEAYYQTFEERKFLKTILKKELRMILEKIVENPEIIEKKRVNALNNIEENYSLANFSDKMTSIYKEALR